jgi:hypothetical protein
MSIILAPDGKTPVSSTSKTAIKIEILHKPAGAVPLKRIPVLQAEIDPGLPLPTVKNVLSEACRQIIRHLTELEVISVRCMSPDNSAFDRTGGNQCTIRS